MLLAGDKLCIIGDWDNSLVPDQRIPIKLKPAYVFGTGHHPTTFQFLSILNDLPLWKLGSSYEVLDVGCGSGILSLACAKLGATTVYAKDISSKAIDLTQENTELNEVSSIIHTSEGTYLPERLPTSCYVDLVLCNINSSEVLVDIISYSKNILLLGGRLIISYSPKDFSLENFSNGYEIQNSISVDGPQGGWIVSILVRNND